MNKDYIEEVLKEMAIELAKKFSYKKGHEDKRKSKNKIGMHFISSNTDEDYYFVQYGTTNITNNKKQGGSIEFRYRFGHPRLDVYLPNKKGFASIEFSVPDKFIELTKEFVKKGADTTTRSEKFKKLLDVLDKGE